MEPDPTLPLSIRKVLVKSTLECTLTDALSLNALRSPNHVDFSSAAFVRVKSLPFGATELTKGVTSKITSELSLLVACTAILLRTFGI